MFMNAITALFGFVAVFDTQALVRGKSTISADYRAVLHEHPVLTCAGTAYILAHLINQPKQFRRVDVLTGYARLFGKRI